MGAGPNPPPTSHNPYYVKFGISPGFPLARSKTRPNSAVFHLPNRTQLLVKHLHMQVPVFGHIMEACCP